MKRLFSKNNVGKLFLCKSRLIRILMLAIFSVYIIYLELNYFIYVQWFS